MNLKFKYLAAAVALAASGASFAGINPDSAGTGQGEIFFSVWDQGTASIPGKSYVRDLGITMADFLANPNLLLNIGAVGGTPGSALAADSALASFLSTASGPVVWTVGGISANTGGANIFNEYGVGFSTAGTPNTAGLGNVPQGFVGINNAIQHGSSYLNAVNGFGPNPTNFTENRSYTVTNVGSDGYHGSAEFSGAPGDWGGFFALDVDTALGSSAKWYYVSLNDSDATTETSDVQTFGSFQLALNGTLTYSVGGPPPAVPLPAAVWLLGSGLLGLVGIGRRKSV